MYIEDQNCDPFGATQNFSAKQNAKRLHGSAFPLSLETSVYIDVQSPFVVRGSKTYHYSQYIIFTISNLTLNFYSATVIIRYASQEPSSQANPAAQAAGTKEEEEWPKPPIPVRSRTPVARSKSSSTQCETQPGTGPNSSATSGNERRLGPRIH